MTYAFGNPDAKTVLIRMADDQDPEGMQRLFRRRTGI